MRQLNGWTAGGRCFVTDSKAKPSLRQCRPSIRPFAESRQGGFDQRGPQNDPEIALSRRLAVQIIVSSFLIPRRAVAKVTQKSQLPQNYVKFARRLLSALRDSMEAELSPANETEVRRKAEPAKKLVKQWVTEWRDASSVTQEVSYKKITVIRALNVESLQILGDFYLKKGQRARLPSELGSRILRLLDDASAALPA